MRLICVSSSTLCLCLLLLATSALSAVLGIDYGQEYTKASLVAPGIPFEIVLTSDSKRKDASGITFKKVGSKDIERVYGNSASGLMVRFPQHSAFYLKPLLGQSLDESVASVSDYLDQHSGPALIPSNNNRSTIALSLHNETYPIEEIIAMSFANIKSRASALLASNSGSGYVKDTAVTIPVHYTIEQRRAIEDAVEIAGLRLIALVNDGVAVAVNFASNRQFDEKKQYHVIYDVGAGSTTATLVSIQQGEIVDQGSRVPKTGTIIDVLGVGYDEELGGHLLTQRVRDILIDKFLAKNTNVKRSSLVSDDRAMNKLWREADRVKMVLSANVDVMSSIESLYDDKDFRSKVARYEFEGASEDLFDRITKPILHSLEPLSGGSAMDVSQVDSIILAGGSVRVPFIQQRLQELAGDSISLSKNVNADEAAVLGATLRGIGISKIFKSKDIQVIDRAIWDYTVSVNDDDNSEQILFGRGTPLGTTKSISLDTLDDDFSLVLEENDREFIRYEAKQVKQAVGNLQSDAKGECINDAVIEAEFMLTHSRTIELSGLWAQCLALDKAVEKPEAVSESLRATEVPEYVAEQDEEEVLVAVEGEDTDIEPSITVSESASTSSGTVTASATATTAQEKVPTIMRKSISTKPKYNGPRPMGAASKQSSSSRLRSMERADYERQSKEAARNDLEAYIYRMRDFFDSLEPDTENAGKGIDQVRECSEWLDNDGQTASVKQLTEKLKNLKQLRRSFEQPSQEQGQEIPIVESVLSDETSGANAAKPTPSPVVGGLLDGLEEIYQAMEEAGLDPTKEYPELGLDMKNLDTYIHGDLEQETKIEDKLEDTANLLREIIALAEKGDEFDEDTKQDLAEKIQQQEAKLKAQQENDARNQEKRLEALKEMIRNAGKSLKMNEMMKTRTVADTVTDTSKQTETPPTSINNPVHDDL